MVLAARTSWGLIFQGYYWTLPGKASVSVPFLVLLCGLPVDVLKDPIAFFFLALEFQNSLIVVQTGSLLFCPT